MNQWQRLRLELVMRVARALRVPVYPHQEFLAEERWLARDTERRIAQRIGHEERRQSGRVFDFPSRCVDAVAVVDHQQGVSGRVELGPGIDGGGQAIG